MKTTARRACFSIPLLALAWSGASAPVAGATDASPFASAKECAACHQSIHLYWSESPHAKAASAPSYLEALDAALATAADKPAVRRGCVWCHAPTALVTGDYELKLANTREGVSCDFCHTVTDVELGRAEHPFLLSPGPVKRGPLAFADASFHETAFSPLHRSSSLLCAACHEHKNALGAPVLSTYTEWRQGPYAARGAVCQACHMPLVPGNVAGEASAPGQRRVNLHRWLGGSAESQLRRGLELRIDSLSISSATADVQVVVANSGVGHDAPGGLSTKSLVLAVGVETASGGLQHRRERVYARELRDAQGKVVSSVPELFLRAATVGRDTRLHQGESRSERFTVPLPSDWKAIVARLEYKDASDPKAGPKTTLVAEQRRERGRE